MASFAAGIWHFEGSPRTAARRHAPHISCGHIAAHQLLNHAHPGKLYGCVSTLAPWYVLWSYPCGCPYGCPWMCPHQLHGCALYKAETMCRIAVKCSVASSGAFAMKAQKPRSGK
eukprot:134111-Pelagomonas_calceolata.AAC.1